MRRVEMRNAGRAEAEGASVRAARRPSRPLRGDASSTLLPGLAVLRSYDRAWLARDVSAGLVLTSLLVPAGMGYAEAAGLPAINGLYATILPLLAYAIAGPSRILVMGPDSGLAALIAAATLGMSEGRPDRAVALASALAVLTGLICVAGGLLKAGAVTDLISRPVRVGYMNGIALTILVTQLPKLLGFSVRAAGVTDGTLAFVRGVAEGKTNPVALAIGASCVVIIVGLRARAPKIPGLLVAVVLATAAVEALDLSARVSVVGAVPRGVPVPALPAVDASDLAALLPAAVGIALVSFADTSVLSRTFAARAGARVEPNRELIGLGVANVAAGFFRGFPISSSASRTPVAEAAGAKTQLTGVVGALALSAFLVLAPRLLQNLPTTALGAIVISAALGIFDLREVRVFRRVRRADFLLSWVAFLGVALLGVIPGIALAIGVSLLDFVRRAWHPHDAVLGRAPGVKGYHDVTRYQEARQIPGLLLFRWDAPLFFANADTFRRRVTSAVDDAATELRWVVVAAEPITAVVSTSAEMIQELDAELGARGIELAFAEMKDPVKEALVRYGLEEKIGRAFFFPTVGVAVKRFLDMHDVDWVDWEDHSESNAR